MTCQWKGPGEKKTKKAKAVTVSFHESSLLHAKILYVKGAGVDGVKQFLFQPSLRNKRKKKKNVVWRRCLRMNMML